MNKENWPDPDWKMSDPKDQGMSPDFAQRLKSVIISEYGNTSGIVVVRNGCIVCEEYFNGSGPDRPVHVASVTKSVLSALAGIAVEQGYISSVGKNVMDYFPEYSSELHDRNCKGVTVEDLLTMTVPYDFEDWKEPLEQLCTSPDWVEFTLDMMRGAGGQRSFKYCTAGAHLLSAVLGRAAGTCVREFANRYLFAPTGMTEISDHPMEFYSYETLFGDKVKGWVHDPQGITTGGWGLTMTPRDMARFGLLYLNGGEWNGSQVIPQMWVKRSVKRNSNHYGYMWWRFDRKGTAVHAAMGDGGNMICWVPDKDLVVAMASGFAPDAKNRWLLVRDHILPAIQ